jgi:hypothetical protein
MSKPLIVSIPHRLGKEEALRRLKVGLDGVGTKYGQLFTIHEQAWSGDHLQFRISALGQMASGSIDVGDDHVHLRVFLPWLLATLAASLQPLIGREGALMLEKK